MQIFVSVSAKSPMNFSDPDSAVSMGHKPSVEALMLARKKFTINFLDSIGKNFTPAMKFHLGNVGKLKDYVVPTDRSTSVLKGTDVECYAAQSAFSSEIHIYFYKAVEMNSALIEINARAKAEIGYHKPFINIEKLGVFIRFETFNDKETEKKLNTLIKDTIKVLKTQFAE